MPARKDATASLISELESLSQLVAVELHDSSPSASSDELSTRTRRAVESLVITEIARSLTIPLAVLRGLCFEPRDHETDRSVGKRIGPKIAAILDAEPIQRIDRAISLLGIVHQSLLEQSVAIEADGQIDIHNSRKLRRRAGVYYTPQNVVDYIVEAAVTQRLKNKSQSQAKPLTILDPACGTGVFLCSAYRALIHWSEEQRTARNAKTRLQQRLEILQNNIFGVDIDADALRLARFALLLESVRGLKYENLDSTTFSLPNLVCGNSLSGPVFGDVDANDKSNCEPAVDWQSRFPIAASHGGFEFVIGNPPYRRELNNKEHTASSSSTNKFQTARMDLWYFFLHRGLELLRPNGTLSFIIPAYWTNGNSSRKLIQELSSIRIEELFHLGKSKVFDGVSGQHMIIRVKQAKNVKAATRIRVLDDCDRLPERLDQHAAQVREYDKSHHQLFRDNRIDFQPPCDDLLRKIGLGTPLGTLGKVRQGIAENPATINKKTNDRHGGQWEVGQGVFALTPSELARLELSQREQSLLRDYHDLCDLDRYYLAKRPSRRLIYSTRHTCPDIDSFPRIKKHLQLFRGIMQARRETTRGRNSWWHLHWPRDETIWMSPKIVSVQMGRRPQFVVAHKPVYVPFSANVWVPRNHDDVNLYAVSAILNSRLAWKWFQHHAKQRGVGLEINGSTLARFPIVECSADSMTKLARLSLERHQIADLNATDHDVANDLERRIDAIVYEHYGLSRNEIVGVETSTTS